ncbi:MAG: agmatinase [Chloroflexota bacterium]
MAKSIGLPSFRRASPTFLETEHVEHPSQRVSASIFGAPLDQTTSFRPGTGSGPQSIREMSWSLETFSPFLGRDTLDLSVIDLGDLVLNDCRMENALDHISSGMEYAARASRVPIMIGGEHTAALGSYRGIKRVYPDAVLLQIDAHLDIREEYEGDPLTHATWVYRAGCEFGFDTIFQLGVRSGTREEWTRARRDVAWCSRALDLPRTLPHDKPIYVTLDIDVLDPAYAPGTGCPEPGGCTYRELIDLVHSMDGLQVVGFDVVEVSPEIDHSGVTAVAAAHLIREAILLFGTGSV